MNREESKLAARMEAQELITRLRGEINARILAEWHKPDRCDEQVRLLRAERDALKSEREALNNRECSEVSRIKAEIQQRLQGLDRV